MKSYKISVTSTRQLLVDSDNQNRTIYIHHDADADIVFIGGADVTETNGFHVHKLETLTFFLPVGEKIYAVKDASGDPIDVWVLLPDGD